MVSIALFAGVACANTLPDLASAWAKPDGGGVNVYFAYRRKDVWGRIVQLTKSGVNVTPAVAVSDGKVYLAWVNRVKDDNYRLEFAVLSIVGEVVEHGVLPDRGARIYSPAAEIDAAGRFWLAWSEKLKSGGAEQVYVGARNENDNWSIDKAPGQAEDVPGVLPVFVSAEPLRLQWKSLTPSGQKTRVLVWRGGDWVEMAKVGDSASGIGSLWANAADRAEVGRIVPEKVREVLMGAVFVTGKGMERFNAVR